MKELRKQQFSKNLKQEVMKKQEWFYETLESDEFICDYLFMTQMRASTRKDSYQETNDGNGLG